MSPKSHHFIEWCLAASLTMMILINIGWGIFRYGGTYYYMKITRPTGTYPITLPVNVSATGYQYQGLATNSKGEKRTIRFQTVAADPAPFKRGQIVRITYNQRYGVTNYKLVHARP
ncbi:MULTISPECIES: YxeA family protein [Lactiplantibacillus]|jgi:uncharacterized protein (TIGR01655 family)|uniref:YxeA family protein n=1 Tax=Lactiplantibacillus pentosus TaxID=1589 RepID=A0A3M6KQV2_LACPE|nr:MULTISPECIES: YxeA family protein [Lactiplantibacillus]MBU7473562.1 YxeA family protein [Lactiplantibacillus pentosus]MBU7528400.1 YxeA family protein [Lactiplantibacillus pentosus]MCC3162944.1 YxeA family protein [Lactiplantibacillus pentosus]MCJ8188117.1 YxeA family protein [Lactiplantibacillus pentosus]MCM8609831.1 YxeA family protein [Lactiplantibacillus sp. B652]